MAGKVKALLQRNKTPAIGLIAGVLFFVVSPVIANPTLEALDDLKVTNVAEFISQLSEIENETGIYTSAEQEYIQLLIGYRYTLAGDYVSAKSFLEKMVDDVDDEDILIRVKALLINIQAVRQEYQSAFAYLEEISRAIQTTNNPRAREHALSVMAYTYNQLEQFETARYFSNMLIESALTERSKCHGQFHYLDSLFGLDDWDEFNRMAETSIQFCLGLQEKVFANFIRSKKLQFLIKKEQTQEANEYFSSFKEDVEAVGYPILTSWSLSLASQSNLILNDFEEAEMLATEALENLNKADFTLPLQNTYFVLYKVSEHKKDYISALRYYEAYSETKQAISDNRFAQQQAYYTVRAEVEVKNQRIELLNKDNELLFIQKNVIEEEVRQTRIMLSVLAVVLSIALYLAYKGITGRRRFKKIAEFDQLTGISNRYHFNIQAALALDYSEKNKQPAAVVLFDLDHFKQINDNYGHAAGDWALQAVVATCRNFMRNNDVFGRIGGEEFAVVLPGCKTDKAALLAEICRDAIASIDTEECGTAFPLTASFGVSGSDTSGYQLKQLLADADKAMYRAKDGGRNQVFSVGED